MLIVYCKNFRASQFIRDFRGKMMRERAQIETIIRNIEKVMIGKKDIAELAVVALLAQGHVLLEDVPGVGKTMMVLSSR